MATRGAGVVVARSKGGAEVQASLLPLWVQEASVHLGVDHPRGGFLAGSTLGRRGGTLGSLG